MRLGSLPPSVSGRTQMAFSNEGDDAGPARHTLLIPDVTISPDDA